MKDWLFSLLVFLTRKSKPAYPRPEMKISDDHWLEGALRKPVPGNGALMPTRRFLVIHDTSGWSGMSSIEGWRKAADGICAHLVIERDGTIYQCRPFNRTCGHAGKSAWRDPGTGKLYKNLNSCAIGIELANAGDMGRTPDVYPSYQMGELAGKPIPRMVARHKNGGSIREWETYSAAQISACERASRAIVSRYNLDDLIGHDDISPDRKVDPGPAYPMTMLRTACGFLDPIPKLRK